MNDFSDILWTYEHVTADHEQLKQWNKL